VLRRPLIGFRRPPSAPAGRRNGAHVRSRRRSRRLAQCDSPWRTTFTPTA
jgi:hypothetical protein